MDLNCGKVDMNQNMIYFVLLGVIIATEASQCEET